jgi:Ca2+-binding RTX toxin-like protein
MAETLTKPHAVKYRNGQVPQKPPSGGEWGGWSCLCYEVMRVRFLLSGLACFALLLVLAALPVVAQGGSSIDPTAACTIKGTAGPDLLAGTAGADVICGYGGNDTITAKGGNDVVRGGAGTDTIYGDYGRDYLYGNRGNDRIYARDSQQDHVFGGRGYDNARVDTPLDIVSSIESR